MSSATLEQKPKSKKINLLWMVITILFYVVATSFSPPEGLSVEGWKSIILMICAIITWVTEFIPLGMSACLFLFLPQLLKISPTKEVLSNFGIGTIFFMLASGIIAKAFTEVGLGYRVSLYITTIFGNKSKNVILSFMVCAGLLSSVLADIPTTIILSSIAYSLLEENGCKPKESNFGKAIMMGIPIAACLGGFATPIGSGVNVLALDLLKEHAGVEITFLQWSAIGVPLAIVLILVSWLVLTTMVKPEMETIKGLDNVKEDRKKLGKMKSDELKFTIIFAITMLLWVTQSITKLDLVFVSLLSCSVYFLPGIDLMDWKRAESSIGWSGILLVGASNALAMLLSVHGSAEWISNKFLSRFADSSLFVLLLIVTAFGLFIHFLIPVANAMLSVCVPIVAVLATQAGIPPVYLILPLAFTAKCIFLLPLDPIPLVTYRYDYWKLIDMTKVGVVIAIIWIPIMALFMLAAKGIGIV